MRWPTRFSLSSWTVPARGAAQPHHGLDQLGLPVALHPGDAEHLAGADDQVDAVHGAYAAVVVDDQAGDLQHRPARLGRRLLDLEDDLAADHQGGELVLAVCPATAVPTVRPRRITVIRSAIALTSLSLWVMNTIDLPASVERAHDGEQLVGLLRGEHRGRLVEDEQVDVAGQRLDDLDPLLGADRAGSPPRRPGRPAGRTARRPRAPRGGRAAGRASRRAAAGPLRAERDVLRHGEDRHQHEVLVHHADAGGDGVARAADAAGPRRRRGSRPRRAAAGRRATFIRVDLPAPFSPSRACTSPGSTVRSMWSLATRSPKRLVMPRSSSLSVGLLHPAVATTGGGDQSAAAQIAGFPRPHGGRWLPDAGSGDQFTTGSA